MHHIAQPQKYCRAQLEVVGEEEVMEVEVVMVEGWEHEASASNTSDSECHPDRSLSP